MTGSVLLIIAGCAVGLIVLSSVWHVYQSPKVRRAILQYMLGRAPGQPIYGLEMIGAKVLPRGAAYVFLAEMEEDGLITSSLERVVVAEGMMRRRVYQLTDKGRTAAQALVVTKKESAK